MRAYNELVSRILLSEDREKFEWSVGSMLTGGIPRTTVILGPEQSGKTTLTTIVRWILTQFRSDFSPRVAFIETIDGSYREPRYSNDTYLFVEALRDDNLKAEKVIIVRTSGDSIPVNTYHVLMRQITEEADLSAIAVTCIDQYEALGPYYYNEIQENNR